MDKRILIFACILMIGLASALPITYNPFTGKLDYFGLSENVRGFVPGFLYDNNGSLDINQTSVDDRYVNIDGDEMTGDLTLGLNTLTAGYVRALGSFRGSALYNDAGGLFVVGITGDSGYSELQFFDWGGAQRFNANKDGYYDLGMNISRWKNFFMSGNASIGENLNVVGDINATGNICYAGYSNDGTGFCSPDWREAFNYRLLNYGQGLTHTVLTQTLELNVDPTYFEYSLADQLKIKDIYAKLTGGNTITGQQDYNGGWTSGGLSIINGDIYAQTGYFYNLTGLSVSSFKINGSLYPQSGYDNTFEVGNETLRWKRGVFGTGTSSFAGNVGIGITAPTATLDVSDNFRINGSAAYVTHQIASEYDIIYQRPTGSANWDFQAMPLDGTSPAAYRFGLQSGSTGANTIFLFDSDGATVKTSIGTNGAVFNENSEDNDFRVESNGNTNMLFVDGGANGVGIGTASPSHPLSFGNTVGNKIALYDAGSGNGYGFGIQSGLLQIYANTISNRVGIGYGNSAAFTETLSVKGDNVGIGTISPTSALEINGNMKISGNITQTNTNWQIQDNGRFLAGMGTETYPGIAFLLDSRTGFSLSGIGEFDVIANSTKVVNFKKNMVIFPVNVSIKDRLYVDSTANGASYQMQYDATPTGGLYLYNSVGGDVIRATGKISVTGTNTGGNAGTDLCIDANNRLCKCGTCA